MSKIQLLGIPFNFGQHEIGVKNAYKELLQRGLIELLERFTKVDKSEMKFWDRCEQSDFLSIRRAEEASLACRLISKKIESLDLDDNFLLNIGGDHGMSLGTIHGLLSHQPNSVVIWADAHGDINTPVTSPSGNFHGMPLAFLLNQAHHEHFSWIKRFLRPQKLILLGPRDLDRGERELIRRLEIQYFSSDEINTLGMDEILSIALHRADPGGSSPIHLSFDVDMYDSSDFSATGTKVSKGPRRDEIFLMAGLLAETGQLRSMDVVEFNPDIGTDEQVTKSVDLLLEFFSIIFSQHFNSNRRNSSPLILPDLEDTIILKS